MASKHQLAKVVICLGLAFLGVTAAHAEYRYRHPASGLTEALKAPSAPPQLKDFGSYRGWEDGTYAASCLSYLNGDSTHFYGGATGSGVYRINLNGVPTSVYCDMTRDGGGWTLVVKAQSNSNAHANAAAVGTLTGPSQSTAWKLSDADITRLPKTMYRMSSSNSVSSVYFDTSDSFASTRQVANKASTTYLNPVWEGPFYNAFHRGLNTYGTSNFNRSSTIGGIYSGDGPGDSCRRAMDIAGGVAGWCGPGDPGTVWVK